MSQNIFIGAFNCIDGTPAVPTIVTDPGSPSGWEETGDLSLQNLKTRDSWKVARSVDADEDTTIIDIDFGQPVRLRAVCPLGHNFSQDGYHRVQLGSTSGASDIYDSAYRAVWSLPFNTPLMTWESMSMWEGSIAPVPISDFYQSPIVLPDWYTVQYMRYRIKDPTNAAGYVELARLFCATGFMPEFNAEYGLQRGVIDFTEVIPLNGGGKTATQGRRVPWVRFVLPLVNNDEAAILYELMRRNGKFGEVLFLQNTYSATDANRYAIYGTMTDMDPISIYGYGRNSAGFRIEGL